MTGMIVLFISFGDAHFLFYEFYNSSTYIFSMTSDCFGEIPRGNATPLTYKEVIVYYIKVQQKINSCHSTIYVLQKT